MLYMILNILLVIIHRPLKIYIFMTSIQSTIWKKVLLFFYSLFRADIKIAI